MRVSSSAFSPRGLSAQVQMGRKLGDLKLVDIQPVRDPVELSSTYCYRPDPSQQPKALKP